MPDQVKQGASRGLSRIARKWRRSRLVARTRHWARFTRRISSAALIVFCFLMHEGTNDRSETRG